ncbi:Snf7-domain-containing protein [Dimargaris cristalligena]|uniref:Snf7-domain-containing protein n=1 Tax=Dimargaris cristalligena TaxID=215637 RepID=A0A4P9ZW74_9FUNG|nr:Snf7-domain-containing protein [Dimargaris cristalligena]|eukprot:RKP36920.1 Snf7-domain-containing protein [Dimargaris cristalligena]
MEQGGELMTLTDFHATPAERWSSWLFDKLVTGPLMWGLQQLNIVEEADPLSGSSEAFSSGGQVWNQAYISLLLLKRTCQKIITKQKELCHYPVTDGLMSVRAFRSRFADLLVDAPSNRTDLYERLMAEVDAAAILKYLERDLKVIVTQPGADFDSKLIKFVNRTTNPQIAITDIDGGIVRLLDFQASLDKQIQALENRIADTGRLAKAALGRQNKGQALIYLRIKKDITENHLPNRMQAYENICQIISKIQEADSDADILAAYKTGATTLQQVLSHHGLTPDAVEEALDEVQATFQDYQEVQDSLQAGIQGMTTTDGMGRLADLDGTIDQQLEEELAALISPSETESLVKTPPPIEQPEKAQPSPDAAVPHKAPGEEARTESAELARVTSLPPAPQHLASSPEEKEEPERNSPAESPKKIQPELQAA